MEMDMDLLREVIRARKKRGLSIMDDAEKEAKKPQKSGRKKQDDGEDEDEDTLKNGSPDDGLAPKLKPSNEVGAEESLNEEPQKTEDAELFGRKPFERGGHADGDLDSDGPLELDEMVDHAVMEQLEDGKKPTKLWDRVQAGILKKKKKK